MSDETPEVDNTNEFIISKGENLPNHSTSMRGLGKFVRQSTPVVPEFRTRHAAYRYAAWLITQAEFLPAEEGQEAYEFDDVLKAVQGA